MPLEARTPSLFIEHEHLNKMFMIRVSLLSATTGGQWSQKQHHSILKQSVLSLLLQVFWFYHQAPGRPQICLSCVCVRELHQTLGRVSRVSPTFDPAAIVAKATGANFYTYFKGKKTFIKYLVHCVSRFHGN